MLKPLHDNLDQVRVFYHVAKNASMTLAARELFITQPAVSHAITLLEERIHCKLFQRTRPRLELTPEGRILYEGTKAAFDELALARQKIDSLQSLETGVVDIGATHVVMRYFLVPFLAKFHRMHPQIRLRMHTENMQELKELQRVGDTDIAVIATPTLELPRDNDLDFIPLSLYRYVFIAEATHYEKLRSQQLTLVELSKYPIIALKKHTLTRTFLDKQFSSLGLELDVAFEVDMMSMVMDFTRYGFGIGAVISPVLQQSKNWGMNLFEIPLKHNFEPGRLVLVKKKHAPLSQAAEAVVRVIQEAASNIVP